MNAIYSRTKIFHFIEKVRSLPADVRKILPPVHVRIKPINACNHRCSYCAYRLKDLSVGKDMREGDCIPKERMRDIIEDLIEMGVKAVTFSGGGEPFLYPHLLPTVRRLKDSAVQFAALTNGSRLEGELAEIFAHHATWLRVSVDGYDDNSYSFYRSIRLGEFSKLIGNLRRFKRLKGKCHLGVSFIVDRHNVGHIYDFIALIRDVGVDSVKISPCIISDSVRENNAYHRNLAKKARAGIAKAISRLRGRRFEILDAYHELDERFEKPYVWCPNIQILPVIGADLNVYVCQDKAYDRSTGLLGSIKNMRFKKFWFSGKAKFFRVNPSRHCRHHCVAHGKNMLVLDYLGADCDHVSFV